MDLDEAAVRRRVNPRELVLSPWVPAGIALLAVLFLRPNAFGESMSPVGLLLMLAAAAVALLRMPPQSRVLRLAGVGRFDPATALVFCVGFAYLYVVVSESMNQPTPYVQATLQGLVLTIGTLGALLVVLRDPQVRLLLVRGFVVLMVVLCASYLVTALLWAVAGVGSGQILMIPIGKWGPEPVYFPFTTTVATQPVFGIEFPRFTGLGREPGWMALYCAVTFFLAEMAGMRTRWVKPLMLVGLLGTVSTAGFGVFVVTWAYHRFLRDRGGISLVNYGRQLFGLAATGLAIWLAVDAPVLGLSAKSTQNAESLDDRTVATNAGLRALFQNPWGGVPTTSQPGINLIADIALSGLPFVLLVVLGLALATGRVAPTPFSNAVVLAVFATLLLSQPAKDSTWAFGLVVVAATFRRPDTPLTRPPTADAGPQRRRTPDRRHSRLASRTIEGTP